MKKYISLLLLIFFCGFSVLSFAQENLKSSKILYAKGLEEIYDVQAYNGGYIALGHKGEEATNKKLWLIKFDKDLNVIGSKVIYNQELVSPFRLQKLRNGNVLVLAQDASKKIQSSILFCLHPEGAISWSKEFSSAVNVELSDMLVTKDQSVYLYGAKKHIINEQPNTDQAILIKIDQKGQQLWQKEIDMGVSELRTKQLILTSDNNLLLTGTLTDVTSIATEAPIQRTIKPNKFFKTGKLATADTIYIEDPISGELEMRIVDNSTIYEATKRESIKDFVDAISEKQTELVTNKTEQGNDRLNNTIRNIIEVLESDTSEMMNPESGEFEMVISEREVVLKETRKSEMKDRIEALGMAYADIIKKNKFSTTKSNKSSNEVNIDTIYVEDPITGRVTMTIVENARGNTNFDRSTINTSLTKAREKTNEIINYYALKVSLDGEVKHKVAINRYADYSFSNAVVENKKGYLFLLQSANYFGDGLLLQTDRNLKTLSTKTLTGSPILFSGLFKQKKNYVIGGVYSNSLKDYSPGFVLLNKKLEVLQSKSSKSLFSHFFISNIASMQDNSFMMSGIGYEHNQASDIYILPYSEDGQSACELESYEMKMKVVNEVTPFELITNVHSNNVVLITDAQFALADDNKFTSGNICTTPDENPVDNKENGSWNQWSNKNADAFSMKIPSDWIKVSPNPSRGEFTVQYDGMQNEGGLKVYVTDMNGRIVHAEYFQNQDVFKLNLRKLGSGVYNLRIDDGFKSQTKKLTLVK